MKLPWFLGPAGTVYTQGTFLSLDFETTNLDKGSALNPENRIILACWSIYRDWKLVEKKHKWGDQYQMGELLHDLRSTPLVVGQNLKFEYQWLKRCGQELRDLLGYDTFLAEWVIAGNRKMELNLDAMAERYDLECKDSTVSTMIQNGVSPEDIPRSWLLRYCRHDEDLAVGVYRKQLPILLDTNLLHVAHSRNLVCPVLADIEFNGMRLDPERVEAEYRRVKGRISEIHKQLEAQLDGVSMTSSKQLGEFLYDKLGFDEPLDYKKKPIRTPGGKRSTGAPAISKLKPKNVAQSMFITAYKEFNKLNSLLTKNLEFFRGVVKEHGGVFYANLNQGRTANHRLASNGRPVRVESLGKNKSAQFQNLPREYKRLFRAVREGCLLGEVDGSQLEFRVAVELGKDRVGYKAIIEERDVHSDTMNQLNSAGMNIDRQDAKPETFKPLYGGSSGTKAQQKYYQFFRDEYANIYKTQKYWTVKVLQDKVLTTDLGLKFYWPQAKMNTGGHINVTTEVFNYPISYTATGEIIPIALVYFWHRTRDTEIVILNTIHDSIIADFPPYEEERFRKISLASLTEDVYTFLRGNFNYDFRTPLGVEVKVAEFWSEGKGSKFNVFPNGKVVQLGVK